MGLGIGLVLALGVGLVTQGWFYGVSSTDPGVTAVIAAVLALAGAATLVLPARRATRIDPVEALRTE
jgi:ABC-type antimicrobial peptide transport system permease subunit